MNELAPTGNMRWLVRGTVHILQQQWGYKNNWSWHGMRWVDVATVSEESTE